MLTLLATLAALGAAQPAPSPVAADPHAQHAKMPATDHSKMDHSRMDHSKMGHDCDDCCKKAADGKMDCTMKKTSGSSQSKGHAGH